MKIAIMQPYVFPYMGYFQLYNAVDLFISLEDVNFIKRGWINRNQILVNGKPQYITFPVKNISQNRYINQHYMEDWEKPWSDDMLKTISVNYKKAPFYKEVFPVIEKIFDRKGSDNLASFALYTVTEFGKHLGIDTEVTWSLTYPKFNLSGQDRIVNICNKVGAKTYINAIGGRELYTQKDFGNINLRFIKRLDMENNLSIIDIVMRRGWKDTKTLLNQYKLIM